MEVEYLLGVIFEGFGESIGCPRFHQLVQSADIVLDSKFRSCFWVAACPW